MAAQGFNNLYTLERGIQNYMKEKGDDLWNGSLFVFDARMAVGPGEWLTDESIQLCCQVEVHVIGDVELLHIASVCWAIDSPFIECPSKQMQCAIAESTLAAEATSIGGGNWCQKLAWEVSQRCLNDVCNILRFDSTSVGHSKGNCRNEQLVDSGARCCNAGQQGAAVRQLPAAAPCQMCNGRAELPHANCANIDCNKLFLACPTCKVIARTF